MKKSLISIANLMHSADPRSRFAFEFWDGEAIVYGNYPEVILRIKSKEGAKHLLCNGFLGFGEAYMVDDLQVEGDLQELLRLGICLNYDRRSISFWKKVQFLIHSLATRNTLGRAPRNIEHHYDLGNDFYQLFLDQTLTYSCGYFNSETDTLEQAQLNKYEHICRKLALQPGETLVDIGCGWGGMLIYAAQKYGIKGLGNTLSPKQCDYAKGKIEQLGLHNQIEVVLQDYREITGKFDKLVSIGMFEHVGKKFIPIFMHKVSQLLKKGAIGLLHTIGKNTESPGDPWITKYIFPGGYIPKLSEIVGEMGRAGFPIMDIENLRFHYGHTLDRWADNYEKNVEKVRSMFDESFVRMWRLYLHGCSAGFKYGSTRLYQILFSNGLNNELPLTRKHLYQDSHN
ncbi:MAG: cyclopropane-fatty-acyl-phospholipid synthase family protein [Deltaproteobacteria bacterium]|nr:cyclopropane-fatty-acyl-phospholipid synthase family protein [Deltaproteobacteria bacterium]